MSSFQSDLDSISSWLPHTFFKSILPNLSTFSFLTNLSPISTLSLNLQSPSLLLSVSPFATLASSSLRLFRGLLTSLVCNKSGKILGLLFRYFSPHCSSTLIRLCISLVRPILEYGSIIWDPSSPTLSHSLDSVQHFALKIASKFRSSLIPIILSEFNLPSLASCHQKAKLIFFF